METFDNHLTGMLKDEKFSILYKKEKELLGIGIKIAVARENQGLTQAALAGKADITQQQLSKIENGQNCNLLTLIKVKNALGIDLQI